MLPTLRAQFNYWGHDCMMMIVSATGDPSNVDNFTAAEFIEDWRLVPNDNNIGQRNVTFAPGGLGGEGLSAGLAGATLIERPSGRCWSRLIRQHYFLLAECRNRRLGLARPQLTSLPSTMKENPYAHQSCRDETPPVLKCFETRYPYSTA